MDIPPWADEELSLKIPIIRSEGEGPTQEFKEDFPKDNQKLRKEVAAFASSNNGGYILIGVHDNGKVANTLDANSEAERDDLIHRAQVPNMLRMGRTPDPCN